MNLNEYVANLRKQLMADLERGAPPSAGSYSDADLQAAKTKGSPQLGSTRLEPEAVVLEFIYPEASGANAVLPIRVSPPERIVFMPVPTWVVETIWQGDIDGSYHFESEARALLDAFGRQLEPAENAKTFAPAAPKRRE